MFRGTTVYPGYGVQSNAAIVRHAYHGARESCGGELGFEFNSFSCLTSIVDDIASQHTDNARPRKQHRHPRLATLRHDRRR